MQTLNPRVSDASYLPDDDDRRDDALNPAAFEEDKDTIHVGRSGRLSTLLETAPLAFTTAQATRNSTGRRSTARNQPNLDRPDHVPLADKPQPIAPHGVSCSTSC